MSHPRVIYHLLININKCIRQSMTDLIWKNKILEKDWIDSRKPQKEWKYSREN
jgi:hypothetical protein